MIRKHNKYSRPRKLYQSERIAEENKLAEKYALKNKREIWKAIAKLKYYRNRAKALANSPVEEQEVLFGKLNALGMNVSTIPDVLDLKVENILERRLPTIVAKKGMASTPQHARQLVVHQKILVNGNVIDIPSYLVAVAEEDTITMKQKAKPAKAESKEEKSEKTEEAKQ